MREYIAGYFAGYMRKQATAPYVPTAEQQAAAAAKPQPANAYPYGFRSGGSAPLQTGAPEVSDKPNAAVDAATKLLTDKKKVAAGNEAEKKSQAINATRKGATPNRQVASRDED